METGLGANAVKKSRPTAWRLPSFGPRQHSKQTSGLYSPKVGPIVKTIICPVSRLFKKCHILMKKELAL